MRILIVTQYYYPERFSTTDIAEGLVKLGNDVTVITGKPCYGFDKIDKKYKNISFEVINGVKVHRVNIKERGTNAFSLSRNYLSFYFSANKFVKKFDEKFDVVLSVSLSPVISICPAINFAKKNKIPCVLYCEDVWPESVVSAGKAKPGSLLYKLLFKWSKKIYSNVDNIIISSPSFQKYFENILGVKNKKFNVVLQPTLDSKEEPAPINYKNKFNLVYAGNIGTLQNVNKLVMAMKFIKTNDAVLHVLGSGSELENLKKIIQEESLENKVIYEGSYPLVEAEAFYKNADLLVVSLKDDSWVGKTIPNKAIQYLKYQKPILGIVGGDAKEMLKSANGSVFSNDKPEEIALKIDEILSRSENELLTMGKNNLKYFNEHLTTEILTRKILKELEETIRKENL